MKRTWMMLGAIGLLTLTGACKDGENKKVLTQEVVFTPEGQLKLKKATNDSVVATLEIEFAEGEYETQTGLMYRKGMQENRGMLFVFDNEMRRSFYMKNTEFALDIIYLNGSQEVVSIQKNAQPFDQSSLPSDAPAKYVLEVNAGLSDQWGLTPGDRMEFTRN